MTRVTRTKNTFDLLTSPYFLSSVFSNYGLLEAMGTSQFTYSLGDADTPATVLRAELRPVDLGAALAAGVLVEARKARPTMGRPTRSPTSPSSSLIARMRNGRRRQRQAAYDGSDVYWDYYPTNGSNTRSRCRAAIAQAIADAKSEVAALQSGTTNIPFPGYDFTPSNGNDQDWFGPGPVSIPQEIAGQADRFYTISPNSHLTENSLPQYP